MYCQQQYAYQTEHPHVEHTHQQHSPTSVYPIQHMQAYSMPNYVSTAPYSPPSDRPSPPSFRIEDILLQSKNGHIPAYPVPYASGYPPSPTAGSVNHGYSYRLAHTMPHQHEAGIGMPIPMHSCPASSEKEYQGMSCAFSYFS